MKIASYNTLLSEPALIEKAKELRKYLLTLNPEQLMTSMKISRLLAEKVSLEYKDWNTDLVSQSAAVDAFLGDIYSGLQVKNWSESDRMFAQEHLRILSGLYGVLKPNDGIMPYRLEMGYRLPEESYKNLYKFWGSDIAEQLPQNGWIINLAAVEYSQTVTKFIDLGRFITPSFLTVSQKTGQPTFVTVHTKIARGAFANWMIKNRITSSSKLVEFCDLGYEFNPELSTASVPVFVCKTFGGLGLSVRLDKR